jgi:fibro-slime domain-containing protein
MRLVFAVTSIVLLFVGFAWSQTVYPPTIRVPVTFYDFHADGSNPDFEPGLNSCGSTGCLTGTGLHLNEVQTTLDAQRKPIPGTSPYFSQRVTKWFRPWQAGDFTVPVYSAAGTYLRESTSTTDTAYKNVVIPDSLTFTLVPGSAGVYRLSNNAFFRLDGRGFGNEPPGQNPPHNYSFTMELHWEFTYQSGLTFNYESNDDMWVFVNGQRVVDLGGLHAPIPATVNLDNTPVGMIVGQKYMLDLFYAQRHVTGCDILITTNIIVVRPYGVYRLNMVPGNDTVSAGNLIVFHAALYDDTGAIRHDLDSLIRWTLIPTGTTSSLSAATGSVDTLFVRQSYTTYIVTASYTDISVSPPRVLTVRDTIYVKPGPVNYNVWIEPDTNIDPNSTSVAMLNRLRHPAPVSLVSIPQSGGIVTVAAVKRDPDGNFVKFPSNAIWQVIGDTGIIRISTPDKPYLCLIEGLKYGNTLIRLSDTNGSVADTMAVQNRHIEVSVKGKSPFISRAAPSTLEYFNLRGRKLPGIGSARCDGVIFERIVDPLGKMSVRKRFHKEQ